ncbi:hypothetical protein DD576_29600, partial [Klebsiella pneumoniae]
MSKLYKDPELVSALRAFLNGELKFGLPQFAQMDGAGEMPIEEEHLDPQPNLDENLVIEIPVNKLGQYFEGVESNATLPITTKGLTVKGVLDGGAGVSMVKKSCWEYMGRPHLEATSVVV